MAWRMSRRWTVALRGIDQLGLDLLAQLGPDAVGLDEVDGQAEEIFQVEAQVHVAVEGPLVELDVDVQVAAFVLLASGVGHEDPDSHGATSTKLVLVIAELGEDSIEGGHVCQLGPGAAMIQRAWC